MALSRSPNRSSMALLPALIALAIFAFEPFNFALPGIGIVDDLFLLPLVLRALVKIATFGSLSRVGPQSADLEMSSVGSNRQLDL